MTWILNNFPNFLIFIPEYTHSTLASEQLFYSAAEVAALQWWGQCFQSILQDPLGEGQALNKLHVMFIWCSERTNGEKLIFQYDLVIQALQR